MSWEAGGRAGKRGIQYEQRWVVRQLLKMLVERIARIRVEPLGNDEHGVDVWIETNDGRQTAQQCKGQHGDQSNWSLDALDRKGVLRFLKSQLERDGTHEFAFVSSIPAKPFDSLADRARRSCDAREFLDNQLSNETLRAEFKRFCEVVGLTEPSPKSGERAYDLLRRSRCELFADTHDQIEDLETQAQVLVTGEPANAIDALAAFPFEDRNIGRWLTAADVWAHLQQRGFDPRVLARDTRMFPKFDELRRRFDESLRSQLACGTLISRPEVDEVWQAIQSDDDKVIVVHGRAGFGKSGVLLGVCDLLKSAAIPFLPFRFDRQPPSTTAREYGERWDLPESPAICLSRSTPERQTVLILDQLDALRWTSGHSSEAWLACREMIEQARRLGNVCVIVACRTYDLEHDEQFKRWQASKWITKVEVRELTEKIVRETVTEERFNRFTARERRLLQSVGNLTMWLELRQSGVEPQEVTSVADLLQKFWSSRFDELRRRGTALADAESMIQQIVAEMDRGGTVSVPVRSFELRRDVLDALQSVNVVRVDTGRITFAHQSYGDYQLACGVLRQISDAKLTVCQWLGTKSQQTLFRREQLRLLLTLLRDDAPQSYVETVGELLASENIRFHLKQLCLQTLGQSEFPSEAELQIVLRFIEREEWRDHVVAQVLHGQPAWLMTPLIRELLARWLESSNASDVNSALWLLISVHESCGDMVAEFMEPYVNSDGDRYQQVEYVLRLSEEKDSDRLFELRLQQLRNHQVEDYVSWQKLAEVRPDRCLRILEAKLDGFLRSPGDALSKRRQAGELCIFSHMDQQMIEGLTKLAHDNAEFVWERLVPKVAQIVELHFRMCRRDKKHRRFASYGDRRAFAFLRHFETIVVAAGRSICRKGVSEFESHLQKWSSMRHRWIQRVLARSLCACPHRDADHCLDWLIAKPIRMMAGAKRGKGRFVPARSLLRRLGAVCSASMFEKVERSVLDFHPQAEWKSFRDRKWAISYGDYRPNKYGMVHYFLLPAMPNKRLSSDARQSLGNAVCKFQHQPAQFWSDSGRSYGGFVSSPIPHERLPSLGDATWLKLIQTNASSEPDRTHRSWKRKGRGGIAEASAEMFARDFGHMAKRQPSRFAKLALKIPRSVSVDYFRQVISALSDSKPTNDVPEADREFWIPATVEEIEAAYFHAQSGRDIPDRWMANCLLHAIADRSEAHWSDKILDEIVRLADHPSPEPEELSFVKAWDERDVGDFETTALNCVRAGCAMAIGQRLFEVPGDLHRFRSVIEKLLADPHPAVRISALGICLPIWNIDRNQAFDWFIAGCSHPDQQIHLCRNAVSFVNYAQNEFWPRLFPVFEELLRSSTDKISQHAASRITLNWIMRDANPEAVESCIVGTVPQREGVADFVSQEIGHDGPSDKTLPLLKRLLGDEAVSVRKEASSFTQFTGSLTKENAIKAVEAYLDSPAFAEDPSDLTRELADLSGSVLPFANVILRFCDKLAKDVADQTRGVQRPLSLYMDKLVQVLLRLYDQAQTGQHSEIQSRCLDTWDLLLMHRVGTVFGLLNKIDL